MAFEVIFEFLRTEEKGGGGLPHIGEQLVAGVIRDEEYAE